MDDAIWLILKILLIAKNLENFRSLPVASGREYNSLPYDMESAISRNFC